MEPKKTPKADIGKNILLHLSIGLALMAFIAYTAINWRSYDSGFTAYDLVNMDELDDEEIPEIIEVQPEIKPPPPVPEIIEIIEDEVEDVEETVIESTETDQEEEIEIEEIEIEEIEEDIEVPFAVIENVPIFPGCDKGNNAAKKKCMSQEITKFVQRKFNTGLAGDLGLSGRQRISVIFKIDKSGSVVGVRARAPHPRLEKEATRVINLLPDMKPGKQRGEAVIVSYSLPIIFQVQD